jgi:hypothetical protein
MGGISLARPDRGVFESGWPFRRRELVLIKGAPFGENNRFSSSNLLSLGKDARESIYLLERVGHKCGGQRC